MNNIPTYTSFGNGSPDQAGVPTVPGVPVAGDTMDRGDLTDPGGGSDVVQPVAVPMPTSPQP